MTRSSAREGLVLLLRALKLPAFVDRFADLAKRAEKEGWGFEQYLYELASSEVSERKQRRIGRHLRQSSLPTEKTLATLELGRLPASVKRQVAALCEGHFVERAENVLAFGLPGRGKTHLLCAIGHELVTRGYRVLFTPAYQLVQRLLVAKRELQLEQQLRRLDGFDAVLIDDIGYIQQDREEMEVLFTFLAERYERRSVMITSNLVFSEWGRIFKDPMTTAAAIDRLVHHAVILELSGPTWRGEEAKRRAEELNRRTDEQPPAPATEEPCAHQAPAVGPKRPSAVKRKPSRTKTTAARQSARTATA